MLSPTWKLGARPFRREILQLFLSKRNRFGFETKITVRIAKRRLHVSEVRISYWVRTFEGGRPRLILSTPNTR